jgi:hypothetical protein
MRLNSYIWRNGEIKFVISIEKPGRDKLHSSDDLEQQS